MRKVFSFLALLCVGVTHAAPPPEVPADAIFGADGQTLSWSVPAGSPETYDVYRGSSPSVYDHQCRLIGSTNVQAALPEIPLPGELFFYLIGAVNIDGAGPLGADSNGSPIPNAAPCFDLDDDQLPDNLDNCPAASNPGQADQDANGVGDHCDPNTYSFEFDMVGQRPAGMEQSGGAVPFTVKALGSDLGVSYATTTSNVTDRFENLLAGLTRQDVTVYLDYEDVAETCSLEFWSDGAAAWDAGAGVVFEVGPAGELTLHSRLNNVDSSTIGPAAPGDGRLRLRLLKGAGNTSQLHVDSWDGSEFVPDYTIFNITDDHRHRGLATALSSRGSGERGVTRVTIVHEIPPGPLTLGKDPAWSSDWKVFQRDASERADVPLKFFYRQVESGKVQARVVHAGTTSVLAGHDYTDHEAPLPATDGAAGGLVVVDIPSGGNYDVHVRLVRDSDSAVLAEETLGQIAVGDVFIAGGQSNMSGRGGFSGGEQRINAVHLFHNDGTWKLAEEPIDDKTDQTDRISFDQNVGHSLMLRFAKEVQASLGIPIGIIPGPVGGSNISSQWNRDESDRENRGTMYGSLLYRTALQGYSSPPRGFLWYQGEADLGRSVTEYKADLQTLIAAVREDYGDPNLPFLIAQLATYSGQPFDSLLSIQEAQRQVVVDDPITALVTTIDQPRGDQVHLLQGGLREVGVRFGNAARSLIYGESISTLFQLVEVSRTIGGTEIELVYDGTVTGGAPALYVVTDTVGNPNVTQVTVTGSIVTLGLDRPLQGVATISYGYSSLATDAWVEDLLGVPVALFFEVSVAP